MRKGTLVSATVLGVLLCKVPQAQTQDNGSVNAADEYLSSKDTSGGAPGSPINCDPMGWPRLYTYNYGYEFVMAPNRILQFFELSHTWRTIWMDGRKLPSDPPEDRWMGWA